MNITPEEIINAIKHRLSPSSKTVNTNHVISRVLLEKGLEFDSPDSQEEFELQPELRKYDYVYSIILNLLKNDEFIFGRGKFHIPVHPLYTEIGLIENKPKITKLSLILDPRKLADPDTDLRYIIPNTLNFKFPQLSGVGYDYDDEDNMIIFLDCENLDDKDEITEYIMAVFDELSLEEEALTIKWE